MRQERERMRREKNYLSWGVEMWVRLHKASEGGTKRSICVGQKSGWLAMGGGENLEYTRGNHMGSVSLEWK